MGIKVENITSVKEAYFCAQLTDENVNNIERSDNQLFAFLQKACNLTHRTYLSHQLLFIYGNTRTACRKYTRRTSFSRKKTDGENSDSYWW